MSLNQQLDAGQKLLGAGKAKEASAVLQEALQKAPGHPHLLLYAGLAGVAAGNASEGLLLLREAQAADPRNHLLGLFYARGLFDVGSWIESIEQCDRVLNAQPGHAGAITLRFLCIAETDPLAGLTGLALTSLPDDSELLGRALYLAERVLLRGQQVAAAPPPVDFPDEVSAGDISLSIVEADRHSTPDPRNDARVDGTRPYAPDGDALPVSERASTRPQIPRWPEGRLPWEQHDGLNAPSTQDIPQRDARTLLKRAHWLVTETGACDRAIVAAEAAMRESPSDENRVLLATRYFEAGRYAEVEASLRDFLPDDPERNTWVGFSLYEMGYVEDALSTLEKAEVDSALASHARGLAYLSVGNDNEARRFFVAAARIDSGMAETRIARAYLNARAANLQLKNDFEAAVVPEGRLDGE